MAYSNSLEFLKMIKEVGSGQKDGGNIGKSHTTHRSESQYKKQTVSAKQTVFANQTVPAKQPVYAKQTVSAKQPVFAKQCVSQHISLNREIEKINSQRKIAVIDTETNWYNEVMSIGIALADSDTLKCIDAKYYIIDPEYRKGGMYSNVLNIVRNLPASIATRNDAMDDICRYLKEHGVTSLYAYNAKFDYGHLKELSGFEWFDIMRIAAYKQFNSFIPLTSEFCKSGRLKRGYSVENILRMISGDSGYCETHNAAYDAMDELKIMELLGHELNSYSCAKIN